MLDVAYFLAWRLKWYITDHALLITFSIEFIFFFIDSMLFVVRVQILSQDKLSRWNFLGVNAKLLGNLLEQLFLFLRAFNNIINIYFFVICFIRGVPLRVVRIILMMIGLRIASNESNLLQQPFLSDLRFVTNNYRVLLTQSRLIDVTKNLEKVVETLHRVLYSFEMGIFVI